MLATHPDVTRASRLAAALPALALLAGCAGPARAPGRPGETLILLENRVAGSCQLTWANARVDERALGLITITPPGDKPATLDRPVLSPGEHTITIAASASCSTLGGSPPPVLSVTQPVYMGKDGGKITVSLSISREAGLAASFTVAGGQVLAPRADGGEVDCRARQPMDWAICRTEAALARAHQRHDVVLMLCLSDKLREMRLLAGTSGPPAKGAAPADSTFGDIESDAAKRVLSLASEAERCIGQESIGESGTWSAAPGAAVAVKPGAE